MEKVLRY